MMKRAGKLLTVLVVGLLGAWGCAKGPANPNGLAEKIQKLEGKCADLEKDYRVAASARDDFRKKATTLEDDNKRLQKQLDEQKAQLNKEVELQKLVVKERDDLRQQIDTRTSERDLLQARCDRLKKGLQNLLGQDDAAIGTTSQPAANTPVLAN
jgi:chromosome segregation ATPase